MDKIFFFYICLGLLALSFVAFLMANTDNSSIRDDQDVYELRVAYPDIDNIDKIETSNVYNIVCYTVLGSLYSTMIKIGDHGEVEANLINSFGWVEGIENQAYFEFYPELRDSSGELIGPESALHSLKRLLVTNNTHGEFNSFLRNSGHVLKSIDEVHPDLSVQGNRLLINTNKKNHNLFNILTSVDFAIIPKKSINNDNLKVLNHQVTSGPFYLSYEQNKGDYDFVFRKNNFYHDRTSSKVQRVLFKKAPKPGDSLRLLLDDKADVLTTDDKTEPSDVFTFYEKHKDKFNLHKTKEIFLTFAFFTPHGREEISRRTRNYLFVALQKEYQRYYHGNKFLKFARQYFPGFGSGGLSLEELDEIETMISKNAKLVESDIVVAVREELLENFRNVFSKVEGLRFVKLNKDYSIVEKREHLVIAKVDTGYHEDGSGVNYALKVGSLVYRGETQDTIDEYNNTLSKEARLKFLKDIHRYTLENAFIIPLGRTPYVSLSQKNYIIKFPVNYSNTHLWKIQKL